MKNVIVSVLFTLSLINLSYAQEGSHLYLGKDYYDSLKEDANSLITAGGVSIAAGTVVALTAHKLHDVLMFKEGGKLNPKLYRFLFRLLNDANDVGTIGMTVGSASVMAGTFGRIDLYFREPVSNKEKKAYLGQYNKKRKLVTASAISIETINDPAYIKQLRLLSCQECTSDEQRVEKYVNMYKKSQVIGARLNALFTNAKTEDLSDQEIRDEIIKDEEIQESVGEVLGENESRINLEMLTQLSLESLIANKFKEQI